MLFTRKKGAITTNILHVVVKPEEEVPLPGIAELEVLEKKAESIVENFKKFCERIGGRLSGRPYGVTERLTCTLPSRAWVRVDARKSAIYGPGDKIERWYVDVDMMVALEDGRKAWFREKSHTARVEGVGISVRVLDSKHTEFWSPAFEWTKVEAGEVTEIGLRTHPVNVDIELVLVGKRS